MRERLIIPVRWVDIGVTVSTGTLSKLELENEQVLFIFNMHTGSSPYTHEFVTNVQDPQLLSSFVSAMSTFMGEVTGEIQKQWKTVYGSDTTLLVETVEWCIAVLAVKRETAEARSKLRRVASEFVDIFEPMKNALYFEGGVFNEFDDFVRDVFLGNRISGRTLLLTESKNIDSKPTFLLPSISYKIQKIAELAKKNLSLEEMVSYIDSTKKELKELVSLAVWNRALCPIFVPEDRDILSLSLNAASELFERGNPLNLSVTTIRLLALLDGKKTLSELTKKLDILENSITFKELGRLINLGYVEKIPQERRLLLVNECIISRLIRSCIRSIGEKKTSSLFESAIREGIPNHPWTSRIQMTADGAAKVILEKDMTPVDLDEMFIALEFAIERIIQGLSDEIGHISASLVLPRIKERCQKEWSRRL
ncbi:MAG: hypothetical protein BAJATHORv1_50175 [Candidatus Thorarchaeota archaeon]|nr:MAG: hypothetical protein BAJATHORv1_50175 [Candidatus Thorarchaeota archaeon]